jgi:tRNA(fMet)-specific endonuclease VapC
VGAVIDSSILIAAERGKLQLESVLGSYGDELVAIASITASELLHGVHRAKDATQRARREAFVERLLAALPVIPFDLLVARVHARLSAELANAGAPVGAHDLLIASTAVALGYNVATRDERSFPRIPGITVLRW